MCRAVLLFSKLIRKTMIVNDRNVPVYFNLLAPSTLKTRAFIRTCPKRVPINFQSNKMIHWCIGSHEAAERSDFGRSQAAPPTDVELWAENLFDVPREVLAELQSPMHWNADRRLSLSFNPSERLAFLPDGQRQRPVPLAWINAHASIPNRVRAKQRFDVALPHDL